MSALASWQLYTIELPYRNRKHWASTSDTAATFAVLCLEDEDGAIGVGEVTLKLAWNSMTIRCLAAALEDVVIPTIAGVDLADRELLEGRLARIREHGIASSIVDMAVWDLRAHSAGLPLWGLLGGRQEVPVSWTVTRRAINEMVLEAADAVGRFGFRALKVKGGQGIEFDIEVISRIREVVGDDVGLFVDANAAYEYSTAAQYVSLMAACGVSCVEDPCVMHPDSDFDELARSCPISVLVDRPASHSPLAHLFVERGAPAVSLKVPEQGVSNCLAIIERTQRSSTAASIGLYAESSIGASTALAIASTLVDRNAIVPCEVSFFLEFDEEYAMEPLRVTNGLVRLLDQPTASNVDWSRLTKVTAQA